MRWIEAVTIGFAAAAAANRRAAMTTNQTLESNHCILAAATNCF